VSALGDVAPRSLWRAERWPSGLLAPVLIATGAVAMATAVISRDLFGMAAAVLGFVTVGSATLWARRQASAPPASTATATAQADPSPWARFAVATPDLFEPAPPVADDPEGTPDAEVAIWASPGAWPLPPVGLDDERPDDGRPERPEGSVAEDGVRARRTEEPPVGRATATSSLLVPETKPAVVWALLDALQLARRVLLRLVRTPQLLAITLLQPVMFVLLFRYVFGGAIGRALGGGSYVDFLMPGIFVQTVAFSSVTTGLGIVDDQNRGVLDRLRSLPMASSALLGGRVLADVAKNGLALAIMVSVGLVIGFRPAGGVLGTFAGLALVLLAGVTFSWIGLALGLRLRNSEAAQSAGLLWLFPVTFASSAFVPVSSLPGWLQPFARLQPVSAVVDAARGHFLGHPSGHADFDALAWLVGLAILFALLAVTELRSLAER